MKKHELLMKSEKSLLTAGRRPRSGLIGMWARGHLLLRRRKWGRPDRGRTRHRGGRPNERNTPRTFSSCTFFGRVRDRGECKRGSDSPGGRRNPGRLSQIYGGQIFLQNFNFWRQSFLFDVHLVTQHMRIEGFLSVERSTTGKASEN